MATQATRQADRAQLAMPALVRHLLQVADAPLVAVMAGVPSGQMVEQWVAGRQTPGAEAQRRLRDADRVVQTLLEAAPPEVVRAWLVGLNPLLDDQAPGLVLAEDPERVLGAARAYRYGQMGA